MDATKRAEYRQRLAAELAGLDAEDALGATRSAPKAGRR